MNATETWDALDDGWKASLEEAWQSWCDGSAGVGAAIVDRHGVVVARDRNRRHDPWEQSALAGSRIADVEMCVLSSVPSGSFDGYTLYTTFEPCLMCASAIILCQIPRCRYAADDPVWDGMHDWFRSLEFAVGTASRTGVPRRADRRVRARAASLVARALVSRRRRGRAPRNRRAPPPRRGRRPRRVGRPALDRRRPRQRHRRHRRALVRSRRPRVAPSQRRVGLAPLVRHPMPREGIGRAHKSTGRPT